MVNSDVPGREDTEPGGSVPVSAWYWLLRIPVAAVGAWHSRHDHSAHLPGARVPYSAEQTCARNRLVSCAATPISAHGDRLASCRTPNAPMHDLTSPDLHGCVVRTRRFHRAKALACHTLRRSGADLDRRCSSGNAALARGQTPVADSPDWPLGIRDGAPNRSMPYGSGAPVECRLRCRTTVQLSLLYLVPRF